MNFGWEDIKINAIIGLVLGAILFGVGLWQEVEVLTWWLCLILGQGAAWIFYFLFINDRKVK